MNLQPRGRSLEEEHFHRVNKKLAEDLKKSMQDEAARKALSEATGLGDEELLQQLVAQGVSPESLVAFSLVPLVAVAWADQKLDEKESSELLARAEGIDPDSVAGQLLKDWLSQKPSAELFETWKDFTRKILKDKNESDRAQLRDEILTRCKSVAQASGGSLGFGKVSPSEKKTLDEIKAVLNCE